MVNIKIDAIKAKGKINEFLKEIEDLLKKPYLERRNPKSDLYARILNFVRATFNDSKEKIESARDNLVLGSDHKSKRKRYIESLMKKAHRKYGPNFTKKLK